MRRRAGHTLVELAAALGASTVLLGAAAAVVVHADRDRALAGALAEDARGLRRAADAIERDVRSAARIDVGEGGILAHSGAIGDGGARPVSGARLSADDAIWRLDRGTLFRGDEVVVRRVASFVAARDETGAVHVRIELAPLTAGAARRAAVTTTVRPRAEEAPR